MWLIAAIGLLKYFKPVLLVASVWCARLCVTFVLVNLAHVLLSATE